MGHFSKRLAMANRQVELSKEIQRFNQKMVNANTVDEFKIFQMESRIRQLEQQEIELEHKVEMGEDILREAKLEGVKAEKKTLEEHLKKVK